MAHDDSSGAGAAADQGCPSCGAEDIERVPERAHDYQCVSCGALFDAETAPS